MRRIVATWVACLLAVAALGLAVRSVVVGDPPAAMVAVRPAATTSTAPSTVPVTDPPATVPPPTEAPTTTAPTTTTTPPPVPLPTYQATVPPAAPAGFAAVRGTVTGPSGAPVANACVAAAPAIVSTTDSAGRFAIQVPVDPTTSEVRVLIRDCTPAAYPLARSAVPVLVASGQATEVAVSLAPGGGLTGVATGAACVRVVTDRVGAGTPVGPDGVWSIPDLPAGPARVELLGGPCGDAGSPLAVIDATVVAGALTLVEGALGP